MLGLLLVHGAMAGESLEQIEACMRANVPKTLQVREFQITSVDAAGESQVMRGRLHARLEEDERLSIMMGLDAPMDLRGAAYLVRESRDPAKEEEMYVFLPALNKTRRVTGNMKGRSLFGTDLSYSDLRRIAYAMADPSLSLEREEAVEGRPAWVVSSKPDPAAGENYDQLLAWVDHKSCVVLRAEFLSAGVPVRRFAVSVADLAQSGDYWYFKRARLDDLAQKTHTVIEIIEVLSDQDLANRMFNPRLFHLAR